MKIEKTEDLNQAPSLPQTHPGTAQAERDGTCFMQQGAKKGGKMNSGDQLDTRGDRRVP